MLIKAKSTSKLGKLVRIELSFESEFYTINSIKITGDFFLHPEETLESLEEGLAGEKLEKNILQNKIQSILKNSQFYGFDVESLSDAILKCATGVKLE